MAQPKGRAWKMERASVDVAGKDRPRSNKYSGSDGGGHPEPGSRKRIWVGGYTRSDGRTVRGHYRSLHGD